MAMNKVTDRAIIKQQLVLARETLQKLRHLSDAKSDMVNKNNTFSTQKPEFQNGYFSPRNMSAGSTRTQLDFSRNSHNRESLVARDSQTVNFDSTTAARDNLVQMLGLQVSKLEDDLKVSLLSYLEEVEQQKEDLIKSFDSMQQQVLQHQKTCHDQHKQAVEKEVVLQKLRASKQSLEKENQRLKREASRYANNSPLPFSEESYPENLSSVSSSPRSFNSHLQNGHSDLHESLIEENIRLREVLRQCDDNDVSRLENKVGRHEKLSDAYSKELASKEGLIKRLKVENRGLQTDVQSLEDEILRVNGSRLNAERDKDKLRQELQFTDEQINTLRLMLKNTTEENKYLKESMDETKEKADKCQENLEILEKELMDLRNKSETFRSKVRDKENCIASLKHDNQSLGMNCDSLRKELSIAKNEAYSLRCDRDRLQKEGANKEIEFLNSETNSRANESKLQELKQSLYVAEMKLASLESKCQQYERKEAHLNQEVLANLEKYTQAEQELFLTKKEQAQLRGFYDSSENKRTRLQGDLESAKHRIQTLENDLQNTKRDNDKATSRHETESLRRENNGLKDKLEQLQGEVDCNTGNLEQLEMTLANTKEQVDVQKIRADNNAQMLKRKDDKIKQLQDELVEVHNQNDALTDELLEQNRDTESLKVSKMLMEQELEMFKSRAKSQMTSEPLSSRHYEPATPDSGISDADSPVKNKTRDKAIERLRKDMIAVNSRDSRPLQTDNKQTPIESLEKLQNALNNSNRRLKQAEGERLKTEQKLKKLTAENENLKEREKEAQETLFVVEKKIGELEKENEELRMKDIDTEKQQSLHDELIEIIPDFQKNGFGELHATPDLDFFREEDFLPGRSSSRIDVENEELRAQNEMLNLSTRELEEKLRQESENLNDLVSQRELLLEDLKQARKEARELSKSFTDVEEEKNRLLNKNEQLAGEIIDLRENIEIREASSWKLQEERERLSEELRQTQENLNQMEELQTIERAKNKEAEENFMHEILIKERDIVDLQNELSHLSGKCESMKDPEDGTKDTDPNVTRELSKLLAKCRDLETEVENSQMKEQDLNQMLSRAEDRIRTLTSELENANTGEKEANVKLQELQQEFSLAEIELHKLNDKNMSLRKEGERNQAKESEYETMLAHSEHEKRELTEKLLEAEQQVQNLEKVCDDVQGRKEVAVETMRESLQSKDRNISELNSELSLVQQKYKELRNMMDTSAEKNSGIHKDLLKTKEALIEMNSENAKLLQQDKELREALFHKEEQLNEVKREAEELEREMNEREDAFVEICHKLEELESLNKNVNEENEQLLHAAQKSDEKLADAVRNLQELDEEKKLAEQELVVTQESITDLETAFETNQDEKDDFKRKLEDADNKIRELTETNNQLLEAIQDLEIKSVEREANLATIEESLQAQNDHNDELQIELNTAENKLSVLETAKGQSLNQEQLLQDKIMNTLQSLNETEIENAKLKSQQCELEKALAKEKQKQHDLKNISDNLEKINEEISKDLEIERENAWAAQDDLESKQKEYKRVHKELQRHKIELEEAETIQTQEMYKKAKLKEELLQANKQIEDLEVMKETLQRDNEQLEKHLSSTREKSASLENKLEETSKEYADLKGQHDEMKKRFKLSTDEVADLEKMLQRQKGLCEDYRRTLVERDESILNLNFSRDAAEGALQSLKSDLMNKESSYKTKKEQVDRLQYELNRTQKKLEKTEVFYEKNCLENEKLQKEVSDLKKRVGEVEEVRVEKELLANQLENYKKHYSMQLQSTVPVSSAEEKVRDWDDKLERAQSRVSDALTELTKDIRRQEQKSFRAGTPTRKKQVQFEDLDEHDVTRTRSYSREDSVDSIISEGSERQDSGERVTKRNYTQRKDESSKNRDEIHAASNVDAPKVAKRSDTQENASETECKESISKELQTLPVEPAEIIIHHTEVNSLFSAPEHDSFTDKPTEASNYDSRNIITVEPPPGFDTDDMEQTPEAPSLIKLDETHDLITQGKEDESSISSPGDKPSFEPPAFIEPPADDFARYFASSEPNSSFTHVTDHTEPTSSQTGAESDLWLDLMPYEMPDRESFSYDVTDPFELPQTSDSQPPPTTSEYADTDRAADSLASTLLDFGFSKTEGQSSETFDPYNTNTEGTTPTPSWSDIEDFETPRTVKSPEISDEINFEAKQRNKNKLPDQQPGEVQNKNVKILINGQSYSEELEDNESSVDIFDEPQEALEESPRRYGSPEEPTAEAHQITSVTSPRNKTVIHNITDFTSDDDNSDENDKTENKLSKSKAEKQLNLNSADEKEIPFQAVTIRIDSQKKTATKVPNPISKSSYKPEVPKRITLIKDFENNTEIEPLNGTARAGPENNAQDDFQRKVSPRGPKKNVTQEQREQSAGKESEDSNITRTEKVKESNREPRETTDDEEEHCKKPSEIVKRLERAHEKIKPEKPKPKIPPRTAMGKTAVAKELRDEVPQEEQLKRSNKPAKDTEESAEKTEPVPKPAPRVKARHKLGQDSVLETDGQTVMDSEETTETNRTAKPRNKVVKNQAVEIKELPPKRKPVEVENDGSPDEFHCRKPSEMVKEIEERARGGSYETRPPKSVTIAGASSKPSESGEKQTDYSKDDDSNSQSAVDHHEEQVEKGRKRVLKLIAAFEGKQV